MDFSNLQTFLCSLGVALIVYSRTFPFWVSERALERLSQAEETIATMRAKLEEYKKTVHVLGEIEKEGAKPGVMPTKKEELEFALQILGEITTRNEDVVMANVRMEVAQSAMLRCQQEMGYRQRESMISLVCGVIALGSGLWMLIK